MEAFDIARVKQGWQVYIWSFAINGWIAQGQPHATEAEAEADGWSFFTKHKNSPTEPRQSE